MGRLRPGANTIRLADQGAGPNLDRIDVLRGIQAESFTASAGLEPQGSNNVGFTGSGIVNFGNSSFAEWGAIDAGTGGLTTLSFRYANGSSGNRTTSLIVNGRTVTSIPFEPTGGWGQWDTVSVPVMLNPGENTIRLSDQGAGPNLGRIDVGQGLQAEDFTLSEN